MAVAGRSGSVEAPQRRGSGIELVLERGAAHVAVRPEPLARGVELVALAMEIPEVRLPFDVAAGAAQFRNRLCRLERLELALDEAGVAELAADVDLAAAGVRSVEAAIRDGFVEAAGTLDDGTPFTCKLGITVDGSRDAAVVVYAPRLYAPSATPAAALPARLAAAARHVARPGPPGVAVVPLAALLRRLLAPRGWKSPRPGPARLDVAIGDGRIRIGWDGGAAGAGAPAADPELRAACDGLRLFAAAERLVAAGDLRGAREAYAATGQGEAHPFAAERLLALLVADPGSAERARALAGRVLQRAPGSAPALLAVAHAAAASGDAAAAGEALAELACGAAARGEEASALAAAGWCLALGPAVAPRARARAAEAVVSIRRDDVAALRALRTAAEQLGDRALLLRACRRLAAYAPDGAEKADAHARLGVELLAGDPPAARLHLDHAIRLSPDDPAALRALAALLETSGEHARAVQALDRVGALLTDGGDPAGAAAAALDAAAVWERAGRDDAALAQAQAACELFPSADAEERAARLAERLGSPADAAHHHAAALELLAPEDPGSPARAAAAHRALARFAEDVLREPARALPHLESALALEPADADGWRRLERAAAALGRDDARRAALDGLAAHATNPRERALALAEAARLWEGAPAESRRRWERLVALLDAAPPSAAAETAPALEMALWGVARAAAAVGDRAAERAALARLAAEAAPGPDRARACDALAAAAEQAGDLRAALDAAARARAEHPAADRVETELRLAQAADDAARAAELLAELARGAGDDEAAADALLRRAALLAERDPGAALDAAGEAARRAPGRRDALDLAAALAAGRDAAAEARALLARAALAREAGEPDAAARLATAARASAAAGLRGEGEGALRAAVAAGLDRDSASEGWAALAAAAARSGDAQGEDAALAELAAALPPHARAGALVRRAELALAAGDAAGARGHAEEARRTAPRLASAVEACRAAAGRLGDDASAAELLGELAALEPARAGELFLERASRLRSLGRAAEADAAMGDALAALPPRADLADAQAALRRAAALPGSWAEPLERFASRCDAPAAAAGALLRGAGIALEQGDRPGALRCARAALARGAALAEVGPVLFRLLYAAGSVAEALDVGRRLLELEAGDGGARRADGWPAFALRDGEGPPATGGEAGAAGDGPRAAAGEVEPADLLAQLAELAADVGDRALELEALHRILALRPGDVAAAARAAGLDADRAGAVERLAAAAERCRRARPRAIGLARAAVTARRELGDRARAARLLAAASAAAAADPAAAAEVDRRWLDLLREELGAGAAGAAAELAAALRAAAQARTAAGEPAAAAPLLEEAAEAAARGGLDHDALELRRALEERARAGDDHAAVARHLSAAAELLLRGGDAPAAEAARRGATAALARARAAAGDGDGAVALARGLADGAPDMTARREALALAAEVAARFDDRTRGAADALEALAADRLAGGADDPPDDALAARAVEALVRAGENARATALLALAARSATGARRAAWLLRLADVALARGDADAARAARQQALAADPSRSDVRDRHLADLEGGSPAALAGAIEAAVGAPGADCARLGIRLARARAASGDDAGAERAFEAVVVLGPSAPGWGEAIRELSARLERRGDRRGVARLLLRRAEATAAPGERAAVLLDAARHLQASGELAEARAAADAARDATPDAPAPWRALASIALAGSDERGAAHALLGLAIRSEPAEAVEAAVEAARLFDGLGRGGDAVRALRAALRLDPGAPAPRRALAERARAEADLAAAARHLSAIDRDALPAEERAEHDRAVARARSRAGDPGAEEAWAALFEADPGDPEAFDLLAAAARARGDADRWLALAARHDGALGDGARPSRRRDLRCERAALLEGLGRLDAAEGAWRGALALDPGYPPALAGLSALAARRAGDGAVAEALARARRAPLDRSALASLQEALARACAEASAARAGARWLRSARRTADALLAFVEGSSCTERPWPQEEPCAPQRPLDADARQAALHPGARTAAARLVALLAPALEGLFPADLGRQGVSGAHRLGPGRAPDLLEAVEAARRALGARPVAAFLADEGGPAVALENTDPPSLVLGAALAGPVAPGIRRFAVARALALVDLGWAVAGRLAARDLAAVVELACRFGGAAVASPRLPDDRAAPFLAALARRAAPGLAGQAAPLAAEAARALPELDAEALLLALRSSASRLALVECGDPLAALEALAAADATLAGRSRPEQLVDPELVDLAAFALSPERLARDAASDDDGA